jgi:hypothetical protein
MKIRRDADFHPRKGLQRKYRRLYRIRGKVEELERKARFPARRAGRKCAQNRIRAFILRRRAKTLQKAALAVSMFCFDITTQEKTSL